MTFGERIVAVRAEKKLQQKDLADLLGSSAVVMGRYERDQVVPSVVVAANIAKALNVSLDYLVNGIDAREGDSAGVNKKLEQFDKLSEKDQEYVLAVLDAFATKAKLQEILGA